jgi:phthiocerol/phenolphthiocerol synthesis type-I polyketide synthase B
VTPAALLDALDRLLQAGPPQVLLSSVHGRTLAARDGSRFFSELDDAAEPAAPTPVRFEPPRDRTDLAQRAVTELCQVLRLGAGDQIDPAQPFFDLGLDSLTALEFRHRLEQALDVRLPSTFAFQFPTLADLVEHLAAVLWSDDRSDNTEASEIDQLDDAAVEALLASELLSLRQREEA